MGLLKVENLSKSFRKRKVVDGVSFEVEPGEIVGLLGPNGAGKTTSFRMTVGMLSPDTGAVTLNGEDITRLPMFKRARLGMGYLSQEASVFRGLSVEDNIMAVLETRQEDKKDWPEMLDALLDELSLTRVRKSKAYVLSGGQKARLLIARALLGDRPVIVLDEPFANIDQSSKRIILGRLNHAKRDRILIVVTHEQELLKIADHVIVMDGAGCAGLSTPPELGGGTHA